MDVFRSSFICLFREVFREINENLVRISEIDLEICLFYSGVYFKRG